MQLKNLKQYRERRHRRLRQKISGTAARPRMAVFVSNANLYVQFVDDEAGKTLVSASTLVLSKKGEAARCNKAGAESVGREIARLAKEKDIVRVVFDRNGYLYHGRIKAVADGAREGGLEF